MISLTETVKSVASGCAVGIEKVTKRVRRTTRRIRHRPSTYVPAAVGMAVGGVIILTTLAVREDPEIIPPLIETKSVRTEGRNTVELIYPDGTVLTTRGGIRYGVKIPEGCKQTFRSAY